MRQYFLARLYSYDVRCPIFSTYVILTPFFITNKLAPTFCQKPDRKKAIGAIEHKYYTKEKTIKSEAKRELYCCDKIERNNSISFSTSLAENIYIVGVYVTDV